METVYKSEESFPKLLKEINDPPRKLYIEGNISPLSDSRMKILCIVGARKYSEYGKEVTENLISGLKGYKNICIVSGLALGIDSIAHRSALDNGIYTVAFPGSGLDRKVIYPPTHANLANEIVERGGALLSEFEPMQEGAPWTFPKRNRLMAGISHATIVIEAELESGSLITSKFASEYNRDVGAVPGPIFKELSKGPHMLIRLGATPITCSGDILEFLGLEREENNFEKDKRNERFELLNEKEKVIMEAIMKGISNRDSLFRETRLNVSEFNMIISSLELEGYIKEERGIIKVGR